MERSLANDVTHVNSVVQAADLVFFRTVRVNTISRDSPRFIQKGFRATEWHHPY
jgi:hypothetical protein